MAAPDRRVDERLVRLGLTLGRRTSSGGDARTVWTRLGNRWAGAGEGGPASTRESLPRVADVVDAGDEGALGQDAVGRQQ